MRSTILWSAVTSFLLPSLVLGQLSGSVGPLTSRAAKSAVKVCNVLNYGATNDESTDLGPALTSAFAACKSGGTVYIPPGNYKLSTWVTLSGGNAWALQWDGIVYRDTSVTTGGNMIYIEHSTDFELYSSTSQGAFQGYGYLFQEQGLYGPRILRLYEVTDFSVHDIILVDSPAYHFTMDTCTSGEVYNMLIRGGNEGGLDGVDVWGTNIWVHDVEVTNKDECVTVKSPASYILVENIYCNWSGGCAMGSLGSNTAISNIEYNNIYTWQSNQMYMIKSNGGNGTVSDCTFKNFVGHGNAYMLDFDSYWSSETTVAGNGVTYSNLVFENWKGTTGNGQTRPPIRVICPSGNPCTGITLSSIDLWTETGSYIYYLCENAYGSGYCLNSGSSHTAYTTSTTVSSVSGTIAATASTMPGQLTAGLGKTTSIAIPTAIPTSFFPGATPYSALLG